MQKSEFIQHLKATLPETGSPVVPVHIIPVHDGLWVKTIEADHCEGDPIKAAKVIGLLNTLNKDGEIQILLLDKEEYSDADLERAITLIMRADALSFDAASQSA